MIARFCFVPSPLLNLKMMIIYWFVGMASGAGYWIGFLFPG